MTQFGPRCEVRRSRSSFRPRPRAFCYRNDGKRSRDVSDLTGDLDLLAGVAHSVGWFHSRPGGDAAVEQRLTEHDAQPVRDAGTVQDPADGELVGAGAVDGGDSGQINPSANVAAKVAW